MAHFLIDCVSSPLLRGLLAVVGLAYSAPAVGQPLSQTGWRVVWSDDFNGDHLDSSKWTPVTGPHLGAKGELQIYKFDTSTVYVRDGFLVVQANRLPAPQQGYDYSSGRITTAGHFLWSAGKVEARIKIPCGVGLWPAFWLVDHVPGGVSSPDYVEIDAMEVIGRYPSRLFGTLHVFGHIAKGIGGSTDYANGFLCKDFHLYTVQWNQTSVTWSLDGQAFKTVYVDPALQDAFRDAKLSIEFNLAVGGTWGGPPNASTPLPAQMKVDFVRVFAPAG